MSVKRVIYRICTKSFSESNDYQVIFGVKKVNSDEIVYFSALELYQNDGLLEKFCINDIRDIVYTAAWEMFLFERKTLDSLKNKFRNSP